MEFKRQNLISLHLAGKSQPAIVRALQHLNVNKVFVYRTRTRYKDTGSIAKHHGVGFQKTAITSETIRKVKMRIRQNPRRSANQIAKDLKVSDRSIWRI